MKRIILLIALFWLLPEKTNCSYKAAGKRLFGLSQSGKDIKKKVENFYSNSNFSKSKDPFCSPFNMHNKDRALFNLELKKDKKELTDAKSLKKEIN